VKVDTSWRRGLPQKQAQAVHIRSETMWDRGESARDAGVPPDQRGVARYPSRGLGNGGVISWSRLFSDSSGWHGGSADRLRDIAGGGRMDRVRIGWSASGPWGEFYGLLTRNAEEFADAWECG